MQKHKEILHKIKEGLVKTVFSNKPVVTIVEVSKRDAYLKEIVESSYSSSDYYDVLIQHEPRYWKIELTHKPLEHKLEKKYHGRFFEDYIIEPRVFAAVLHEKEVGWIELGYDKWNNRMRVWEFLVEEHFRRRGIGTLLMKHAAKIANERGVRMLILETQSNNAAAIEFYLKFGFQLVGFDVAAYSNEGVEKAEFRIELGLSL